VVSCSHFAQPAPPTSAVTLGTLHAPADRQESGHFNIATDRVFCYRTRWLSRQPPKPIQPSEPLASAVPTRENLAHQPSLSIAGEGCRAGAPSGAEAGVILSSFGSASQNECQPSLSIAGEGCENRHTPSRRT
jgi:hypothetical protein